MSIPKGSTGAGKVSANAVQQYTKAGKQYTNAVQQNLCPPPCTAVERDMDVASAMRELSGTVEQLEHAVNDLASRLVVVSCPQGDCCAAPSIGSNCALSTDIRGLDERIYAMVQTLRDQKDRLEI